MIAPVLRSNLMTLARGYAKATGMTLGGVSHKFYGNASFFAGLVDVASKRSISIDKYDEVVMAIRKAWPPDAEWPMLRAIVIPRPSRR